MPAFLGAVGGDIAKNVLGNWAGDILGRIPFPGALRPQGEPNHDLQLAFSRAVARACDDLDLEALIRDRTGSLTDLRPPYHAHVEDFLKHLQRRPEEALRVDASNADLKSFLEDPTLERFAPLASVLGEDVLPGLPKELRAEINQALYLRIAARFWDEVKESHRAWRAYTAEVFAEFRASLAQLAGDQREILRRLDERERVVRPQLSAEEEAVLRANDRPAEIPGDILPAIEATRAWLEDQFRLVHAKLDFLLAGQRDIKRDISALRRALPWVAAALLAIGGLAFWIKQDTARIGQTPVPDFRALLTTASHRALEKDLQEADTIQGDWEKREKLRQAAETAHRHRLSRVETLAAEFARLAVAKDQGMVLEEMLRILKEQGIDDSLAFLESRRASILENVSTRSEDARRELEPLLRAAQLATAEGRNDQAESLFRDILRPQHPGWPQARHEFFGFLAFTKGPRAQSHGTLADACAIYEESERHALRLIEDEPENPEWQRNLASSHDRLGDVAVAQGRLDEAARRSADSLAIAENLAKGDPGNTERQRDLSVNHVKLGDVAAAQGKLDEAARRFADSFAIVEKLAKGDPGNVRWQSDLSICHNRLGDVAVAQGRLDEAARRYVDSFAIVEKLAKGDPGNAQWQRDLSVSHNKLGDVAVAQGRLDEAARRYIDSFAIVEKLAKGDPGNAQWQRDLFVSHSKLAGLADKQGDASAFHLHLQAAHDALDGINRRGLHLSPNDRAVLKHLKEVLSQEPER